jgi:hypothetical protein
MVHFHRGGISHRMWEDYVTDENGVSQKGYVIKYVL